MDQSDARRRAAAFWDERTRQPSTASRWWGCPPILRHVNRIICGRDVAGNMTAGLATALADAVGSGSLRHAVSVGCGGGTKERALVQAGLVERFTLYEISKERLAKACQTFEAAGLSAAADFRLADAFEDQAPDQYDLVHWASSLHHMFDVDAALQWSRHVLKPGGFIVIYEYIGPTRFQWSDRALDWIETVRKTLPREILERVAQPGKYVPLRPKRVDPERLRAADPSEAADSDRIVPRALAHFPYGRWTMLGGVIYATGLSDIVGNFERLNRLDLLHACLLADQALSALGENHYGFFISRK
jgi:SAM-dependent methyltransferase